MLKKIKLDGVEVTIGINTNHSKILSNSYLFKDKKTMQVDAGIVFDEKVDILILTHGHPDHIAYVSEIKKRNPRCVIMASAKEVNVIEKVGIGVKIDKKLKEGDKIDIGNLKFTVIETPGHTKGSISLYEKNKKILLSGDTWFGGFVYGRTDFPTGSEKDMQNSLKILRKLKVRIILPGH